MATPGGVREILARFEKLAIELRTATASDVPPAKQLQNLVATLGTHSIQLCDGKGCQARLAQDAAGTALQLVEWLRELVMAVKQVRTCKLPQLL